VKNNADALIFHTTICVEAPQIVLMHRAKTVSKTQFIQKQIEKDVELVQTGKIKAAHWHFYRSPTTGKIGASRPLLKLLDDCNIKVTIHY